jgi:hypothetical protein
MPTYKFIITIIGGTWNGTTIIRFTEQEKNYVIDSLKDNYGVDCSVEKIKLY